MYENNMQYILLKYSCSSKYKIIAVLKPDLVYLTCAIRRCYLTPHSYLAGRLALRRGRVWVSKSSGCSPNSTGLTPPRMSTSGTLQSLGGFPAYAFNLSTYTNSGWDRGDF